MPDRLRFGRFELQATERQLLDDGRPVAIGSRAFDLLMVLVERRNRLVTKAELLDLVWPGLVVEEGNLPVQVSGLRKIIGAHGIATVPGLGYRFAMSIDGDEVAAAVDVGPPTVPAPRTNVPLELDALLGRDSDVAALPRWLAEHRLVTVLGAGGIGKTRVAQAVAGASLGAFRDGVWWVDLAALSSAEKIAPAIAAAAHLQVGDGDASAQLVRALAPRETLLVLDNCEHLASAVAIVVREVLASAAGVRVLATSQEALKVSGEHVYLLSPLAVPPVGVSLATARGFAAIQLLEHGARAADPRFALTDATIDKAVDLCRQLEGLALAIEMAAARLPFLGVHGLHARLGDRLTLLRAGSREVPSRQRTLRATLDWSHELLDADERAVLRRLAVFVGSFRLDAAQQTAAFAGLGPDAVLEALAGLVDRSLVKLEQLEPPRYRLAESIRLFAWERLHDAGEADAALRRHGEAMALVAVEAEERSQWPEGEWRALYGLDYDDLAEAFDRACQRQDSAVASATVLALRSLDEVRGGLNNSGRRVKFAHDMLPTAERLDKARLCHFIASCAWIAVAPGSRIDTARLAVELWRGLGDDQTLCSALEMLGMECARSGAFEDAERAFGEVKRLEDPAWPARLRAMSALHRGYVAGLRRDVRLYRECLVEARALFQAAGATSLAAHTLDWMAEAALLAGKTDESIAISRTAVDELRCLDHPAYLGFALTTLCKGLLLAQDLVGARAVAAEALATLRPVASIGGLGIELALLAATSGRAESAALLLGHGDAWRARTRSPRSMNTRMIEDQAEAAIEADLGTLEHHRLREAGKLLSDEQIASLARELLSIHL